MTSLWWVAVPRVLRAQVSRCPTHTHEHTRTHTRAFNLLLMRARQTTTTATTTTRTTTKLIQASSTNSRKSTKWTLSNHIRPTTSIFHRYSSSSSSSPNPPTPPSQAPRRQAPPQGKERRGPFSWRALGVSCGVGSLLLLFMLYVRKEKELALARERKRALGKAKIGGTFDLIDHNGVPRTSHSFKGQWLLLYFGFTHCPDVCPDQLEKIAQVVDALDKMDNAQPAQPLFITVDPARDSQATIGAYLKEFHARFLGLTGSEEKVLEACRAYRVYHSAGPRDDDDDYIVDHTIITYLVNPEGDFVDYYGQNKSVEEIVSSVALNMRKYQDLSNPGLLGRIW